MRAEERIISTAIENGATLAGIASVKTLKKSASHTMYKKMLHDACTEIVTDFEDLPDNEFITDDQINQAGQLYNWPETVKSVLVIGLSHPKSKPELDWWDGRGTLGNRIMIDIIKMTSQQIEEEFKIKTHKLHYYVEKGGIFLKDAAVLSGLGCIGRNNLLITPTCGPRIRLRALFIEAELDPTGPVDFDPCADCPGYCRTICSKKAMDQTPPFFFDPVKFSEILPGRDGMYHRDRCNERMEADIAEGVKYKSGKRSAIKFCRNCELVCPVGKK